MAPGGPDHIRRFGAAADFSGLRGYQIGLDSVGGEVGSLEVVDLYIDKTPKDHVFASQESYHAVDIAKGRMMCAVLEGGLSSREAVYLGTFVFRATAQSRGTFQVIPRTGDGTILLDSSGRRLEIVNTTEAAISLE